MIPDFSGPALKEDIKAIERETGGLLCFAVRDLQTGHEVRYQADQKCKTASIIKFPILVHVALSVAEGALSWEDKLTLTDAEKVGGAGVLRSLTAGLRLTLRDVCVLMTILSDNTATNMVIEHVGVAPINDRMRQLGLPLTTLFRKAYSPDTPESREYGLGMTTPDEMLELVTRAAQGEIGGAQTSRQIIEIIEGQTHRDAIPRLLPEDWKYAGKTGAIDPVRNDIGLVTSPDGCQFALSLFCQNLPTVQWDADNPGLLGLARLTRRLLLGTR